MQHTLCSQYFPARRDDDLGHADDDGSGGEEAADNGAGQQVAEVPQSGHTQHAVNDAHQQRDLEAA